MIVEKSKRLMLVNNSTTNKIILCSIPFFFKFVYLHICMCVCGCVWGVCVSVCVSMCVSEERIYT